MTLKTLRGERDTGQAMVELAIVLPILLLIVFGVIQFGSIYNHYESLTDATRAGARMASVSRKAADPVGAATQAVRDSAANLDQAKLAVTISPSPPWTVGSQVTVTATYPYAVNLAGLVVKSGSLTSTTKERVE